MQVVSSSKNLKVVTVWYQSFHNIIDLLRLLRLTSPLRKDNIRHNIEDGFVSHISFYPDQASLFGVLQVESMTFCNLTVHCLFYPGHFVHELVAMLVEHVQGEAVLRVDDPNKEEALRLDLLEWQVQDILVGQGAVGDSDTSSWVG